MFNIGDVVMLNSEDTAMTVQDHEDMGDGQYAVRCCWMNADDELQSAVFISSMLQRVHNP